MMLKMQLRIKGINYILKYIQIEKIENIFQNIYCVFWWA